MTTLFQVSAGHFNNSRMGLFAECGICRMVLLLTVPYLFAITCKSCLAIVWLEWDIRLIGQPEVQIYLHWTSIYGVRSGRELTDKALLLVFDSCGIASLMPSTTSDAPERYYVQFDIWRQLRGVLIFKKTM